MSKKLIMIIAVATIILGAVSGFAYSYYQDHKNQDSVQAELKNDQKEGVAKEEKTEPKLLTYTNLDYPDFSFQYPEGWVVDYLDNSETRGKNTTIKLSKDSDILEINFAIGYPSGASIYKYYGYKSGNDFVKNVAKLNENSYLARFKQDDKYIYLNAREVQSKEVSPEIGPGSLLKVGNYVISSIGEEYTKKPTDDQMMNDVANVYIYFSYVSGKGGNLDDVDKVLQTIDFEKMLIGEQKVVDANTYCENCMSPDNPLYEKILKVGKGKFESAYGSESYDYVIVTISKQSNGWILGNIEFNSYYFGETFTFLTDGQDVGFRGDEMDIDSLLLKVPEEVVESGNKQYYSSNFDKNGNHIK